MRVRRDLAQPPESEWSWLARLFEFLADLFPGESAEANPNRAEAVWASSRSRGQYSKFTTAGPPPPADRTEEANPFSLSPLISLGAGG
jgi:hypothetical protein